MQTILLIDDEPLIIKMYEKALSHLGYNILSALDGKSGVELAQTEKPDLILMDVMMPDPNGIAVLETLKSDDRTKNIIVCMITNLSGKYDVELALGKGAKEVWQKADLSVEKIGAKVKEVLFSIGGTNENKDISS